MLARRAAAVCAGQLQPGAAAWSSTSTAAAAASAASGSGTAGDSVRQAFSYCVNQVRTYDYENYLWVQQMPKELRAPLFALRAFNVETALIGEHAKGEMLVLMRCQWWRDALNNCFKGQPPAQPVITALAEVLQCGRQLTRYRLQQLVSAREEDLLRSEQPASLAALERYAEGTAGQLLHLQLEAAGLGASSASAGTTSAAHASAAEHAASHLGKAVGLATLLRGTHTHASRGRVYLPADLCSQHGVTEQDVLSGHDTPAVRDVTLAVATAAQQHLQEARRLRPQLAAEARPLFLPAIATGMYLEALERAGFNLFDQQLMQPATAVPPLTYQLKLKWALLRGTY